MHQTYPSSADPCDPSPVSAGLGYHHEQPGLMAPQPMFDPRSLTIDTSFGGYGIDHSSPYSSVPGSPGGFAPSTPGYDAPGTPASYAPPPTHDQLLAAFGDCAPYNMPSGALDSSYASSPAPSNISYEAQCPSTSPVYTHAPGIGSPQSPSPHPTDSGDYSSMFGAFQVDHAPTQAKIDYVQYGYDCGRGAQQHQLLYHCDQPDLTQLDPTHLSTYMSGMPTYAV